ncbi:MAG: phospholipase D family protein [Chiayiivirga sp.]|jgi:putative cardiolipin synthase|uniref:phospholipase D family protein n=1 Tax=Chiayiivirga sp. TaxID=2041042 RepID=UPI0025BF764C|nr:phospholipase D family protein [Chiayiivirga sp.]MCI1711254.1 phospholipase D family protein [Chiayiivirga sp.]MCI1727942.1 phospholipase D family protein [Chiayiivirga sp.]
MIHFARLGFALALCLLAACMPNRTRVREALDSAALQQDRQLSCAREDHCALPSRLRELGDLALAESTPDAPHHRVLLLDRGQDALLARVHLIRAARDSIELQSFIFAEDDAGYLTLNELLQAARRGVKVRVLLDQLFSVDNIRLLARLAQAHVNFELRLYNPTFGEAKTGPVDFFLGAVCCFTRFNQRMHNKLLLVDGRVGITGGRNYQNRYFDWDPGFNYRDRDILVAGPVAERMRESFEEFWGHRKTVPVAALRDVRRWIGPKAAAAPLDAPRLSRAAQILELTRQAEDAATLDARLLQRVRRVGRVDYVSDVPNKPFVRDRPARRDLSRQLQNLLHEAEHEVLLQTPYLVFSRGAQKTFRELHARAEPPRVIVSTNSLASTDAFPVYALSHKYKRRYLREFGFRIHETKPFPASAPIDLGAATGAEPTSLGADAGEARRRFGSSGSSGSGTNGPLPLQRAGVRIGLHAKSMVIDERIAMVGTHNFDPRSDRLNTESAVIVHDAAFARELADVIRHDALPENSWTIARRPRPPILSGVNYSLGKVFEALPLFDFWPFRYATSYELKPGCAPLPPDDPGFAACYEPVGDFPEVGLPLKSIYTRVLTAFGAGLAPIL